MIEKVLTDDEKEALLEGVSSGAVEVQSAEGPKYASVQPYEIGPRSRIVSNSYPRLQLLNHQLADELSANASSMVQIDVRVRAHDLALITYNECIQRHGILCFALTFNTPPLDGSALITLDADLLRNLVESFFGGNTDEVAIANSKAFTDGETGVARLFCNVILGSLKEVATPLAKMTPEPVAAHTNIDLVELAASTDRVICSEFEISFSGQTSVFRIMWPIASLRPLLPVLEGQKKERDKARDLLWARELRRRIADMPVELTTTVGHAGLKLADLIGLAPGDMIGIENPGRATVFAKRVPIIEGRFGVHGGRNAVETLEWLTPDEADRT